jgi:hypothetical protein
VEVRPKIHLKFESLIDVQAKRKREGLNTVYPTQVRKDLEHDEGEDG